jgi:hypothetical protein
MQRTIAITTVPLLIIAAFVILATDNLSKKSQVATPPQKEKPEPSENPVSESPAKHSAGQQTGEARNNLAAKSAQVWGEERGNNHSTTASSKQPESPLRLIELQPQPSTDRSKNSQGERDPAPIVKSDSSDEDSRAELADRLARVLAKQRRKAETHTSRASRSGDPNTKPLESPVPPDSYSPPVPPAPGTLPSATTTDSSPPQADRVIQVQIVKNVDELLKLDPGHFYKQLIVSGEYITNRSLNHLEELRAISVSIEAFNVTNAGLFHLTKMNHLRELRLWTPAVNDDGLGIVAKLVDLELLDLEGTSVRGSGLTHLSRLGKLQHLTLSPLVEDRELGSLTKFPALKELDLRSCHRLTDDCAESIGRVPTLETVWLPEQISEDGKRVVRDALPDCRVRS